MVRKLLQMVMVVLAVLVLRVNGRDSGRHDLHRGR